MDNDFRTLLGVNAFVLLDKPVILEMLSKNSIEVKNMEQEQRNYGYHQDTAPVMTIGNWVVTLLVMIIPIVNIIMLIVWAAGNHENPNRKNWAVAQLIFFGLAFALWIFFFSAIVAMMGNLMP